MGGCLKVLGILFAAFILLGVVVFFADWIFSWGGAGGATWIVPVIAIIAVVIVGGLIWSAISSSGTGGYGGGSTGTSHSNGSGSNSAGIGAGIGGGVAGSKTGTNDRRTTGKQLNNRGRSGKNTGGLNKEGWQHVNAHCANCNRPLTDKQRNNRQFYCSQKCYGEFRRKNYGRTRPDF
ncbi:MAG: hypothetical protein FWE83_00640 [Oscillospiraceae bacterium]|nr:hypothetical protein [Oscillospiraceae bacterium]